MTLRRRLLLLLLPALALLMLGGGLIDYRLAIDTTSNALDRALASRAVAAGTVLAAADAAGGFAAAEATIGQQVHLDAESGPKRIALSPNQLLDPDADGDGGDGEHYYYALAGPGGALLGGERELARLPLSSSTRVTFADARVAGRRVRVARLGVGLRGGIATVTVAETRERRARTERVMLFGKLLVDFAELDLTLLLIWFGVYFGLRPLARVRDQAEAYSLRDLTGFDEQRVPGELRSLIVAFNRVLELLQEAARVQRRFVANAAHQMRTPVAGLLAQIELLVAESGVQPIAAELIKLQRAAQSMAHSANQLLALARAEPLSALNGEMKPLALDQLVRDLVERQVERADQAGIDLGAEAAQAEVMAEQWLLEDLLGNLLDNAIKYTPRGGHVTVRSGVEERRPFLEVEDDGAGIPEAERARVRERFYRSPGSPGIGAGLGLSIVEEIARIHGASLSIGAGAGGRGARLRVQFTATH